MPLSTRYTVTENEDFAIHRFPCVNRELTSFSNATVFATSPIKAEIVIYYLDLHAIKNEWIRLYPELITLLTSRYARLTHSENLFSACRGYTKFSIQLQRYILHTLDDRK
jgi:hypothetical protein